jgi:hypothetical protein
MLSEYQIWYWRTQETIGYWIKASLYQTIGYRTQKKLSVAHLCIFVAGVLNRYQVQKWIFAIVVLLLLYFLTLIQGAEIYG